MEKQYLTEEEKQQLLTIQQSTQDIVFELGEIELVKIQLETRYERGKQTLKDIIESENRFNDAIFEKYGKITLDTTTGEITTL